MKTSRMLNRKITKPRQSQYFRAKPTDRRTTSKREESERNADSASRVLRPQIGENISNLNILDHIEFESTIEIL